MVFKKTIILGGHHRRHIHIKRGFVGGSLIHESHKIHDNKHEEERTTEHMSNIRPHDFQFGRTRDLSYVKDPHKKRPIKLLL